MTNWSWMMVILAVFFVPLVISPRWVWGLTAWMYRNPEANEPSEAAHMVTRVVAIVMLVVFLPLFGNQHVSETAPNRRAEPVSRALDGGFFRAYWAEEGGRKLTLVYEPPSGCRRFGPAEVYETGQHVRVRLTYERASGDPALSECPGGTRAEVLHLDAPLGLRKVVIVDDVQSRELDKCDANVRLSRLCMSAIDDYDG
ncbi:DUF6199 family natural product biosynthesis protein [Nonomuraea angiospora]|uniref:DUF6199 family natural product biosynthesis protein n=1 Tax=Nonomuraea angiospora TaxID=46172 RepID=UPI0029A46E5F|nr:DUF6199 family natural product biosynthesis protein [Nonomuraea angiospora]MDX3104965.1 hypothetical protein [Nonomuraea angiospora]